ncbi:MAG: flagellar biosynthetic protein FliR [Lachnospiraceae bacterium]|nr:flagellar biosynthetic protein FliR [Lachnospiraceae bacterium]
MQFTVEYLEYILLILVRISSMMVAAPFFNSMNIPRKVKAGLAVFFTIIALNIVDYTSVEYVGILGYTILILQESITGLMIGIASGFCLYILSLSGHMIDMEIGFSMAMEFDPATNIQSTISANLFSQLFLVLFVVSDMHYFLIDAIYDSYQMIPIGGANINGNFLPIMITYITDYFIIGFRIILPIFSCILVINVVLGILAKVAPQMNMFVIGMQLKVFVGLFLLFMLMALMPNVTDFLFQEMQKLTHLFVNALAPQG